LGIGDWGLGIGPNPHPQSPIPKKAILQNIIKTNIKIKSKSDYNGY